MVSSPNHRSRQARIESAALRTESDDHTRCPQALYQREQVLKQRGNGADQPSHYVSYASAVKNNGQSRGVHPFSFSIPTKNRFDLLSRNIQGNW